MFEKQREVTYSIEIESLWDYFINYNWSNLIKGYSVTKEENTWNVQLDSKTASNIQVIEVSYNKDTFSISIKITPKFNKKQSYDLMTIILIKKMDNTLIKMNYGFYPKSFAEKIMAKALNNEDNIFEEYSNELFSDISKNLIKNIYG